MKFRYLLIVIIIPTLLLSACGSQTNHAFDVAVAVSLTQTADAPAAPDASAPTQTPDDPEPGILKGKVRLVAPPTPAMIVYALDPNTGQWATMQTDATDGEAAFELSVYPGIYMVYAFAADGRLAYAGFPSGDELDLGLIEIEAGQVIEDIEVRPPSQADCGNLWGVPTSPDGRFAGFMASEACLRNNWAGGDYVVPSEEICQSLQEIAQDTLNIPFELDMMDSFSDNITGESGSGCTIISQVTGDQLATQNGIVEDLKNAYLGWEEDPMYQASGPMGNATALRRDMALMLIGSTWEPAEGVDCPDDQPISACELTPQQKAYTIKIQVGMQ